MSRTLKDMVTNCLLMLAILGAYAVVQDADAIADHHHGELEESAATQDAIKNEAASARFARAAAQMCGNADYLTLDDTTIQCVPRKGPTRQGAVVQLAQGGAP